MGGGNLAVGITLPWEVFGAARLPPLKGMPKQTLNPKP